MYCSLHYMYLIYLFTLMLHVIDTKYSQQMNAVLLENMRLSSI